jgi:hypothetical protein
MAPRSLFALDLDLYGSSCTNPQEIVERLELPLGASILPGDQRFMQMDYHLLIPEPLDFWVAAHNEDLLFTMGPRDFVEAAIEMTLAEARAEFCEFLVDPPDIEPMQRFYRSIGASYGYTPT